MPIHLHTGNCLDVLRGMEAQSVNCCVTSPPPAARLDLLGQRHHEISGGF